VRPKARARPEGHAMMQQAFHKISRDRAEKSLSSKQYAVLS
jgi:hypothetical protein